MSYFKSKDTALVVKSNKSMYGDHWEKLPDKEGARLHRLQCAEYLAPYLSGGAIVSTTIRSVARSGMSRTLSAFVVHEGRIVDISFYVGIVCGYRLTKDNHIVVGGCGFDAGHDVVHSIGQYFGITLKQEWL